MTMTAEAPVGFAIGPDGFPVFEPLETVVMDPDDPFAQEGAPGALALQLGEDVTLHEGADGTVLARRGATLVPLPTGLIVGNAGEASQDSGQDPVAGQVARTRGTRWGIFEPQVVTSAGLLPGESGPKVLSDYAVEARVLEGSLRLVDPEPLDLGSFLRFDNESDLEGEWSPTPQYQDAEPFDWFKDSQPPTTGTAQEKSFDWFATKTEPAAEEPFDWFGTATPTPESPAEPAHRVAQPIGLLAAEQVLGMRPVSLADIEAVTPQYYGRLN